MEFYGIDRLPLCCTCVSNVILPAKDRYSVCNVISSLQQNRCKGRYQWVAAVIVNNQSKWPPTQLRKHNDRDGENEADFSHIFVNYNRKVHS